MVLFTFCSKQGDTNGIKKHGKQNTAAHNKRTCLSEKADNSANEHYNSADKTYRSKQFHKSFSLIF